MRAVLWGFGVALLHRVALTVWMIVVWSIVGANLHSSVDFHTANAQIPALVSPAEQNIFGVWRRWDSIHYLDLAVNGYHAKHPGPTVFGVLVPFSIHVFDAVLPGSVDLAAMVFETLAFGLALTLIYKVGEAYYGDAELGRWALIVTALLPLSYFFQAPMSESIYLAMALGVFYFGTNRRWFWAAICGFLATLARSQGFLLLPIAGLLLLEQNGFTLRHLTRWRDYSGWVGQIRKAIAQGWVLLLIPLGFVGFMLYRQSLGLPSLNEIYNKISYAYLVEPLEGLIINLRWIVEHPADAITRVDLWALVVTLILSFVALRFPRHRRLPLIAYNFGFILVFVSKVNWIYGTNEVFFTQSFGRYALALFPLTFLVADGLRATTPLVRVLGMAMLLLGIVAFSALFVLALTGP
jgi:hypothetical protein